jgi:putative flippase GtrA
VLIRQAVSKIRARLKRLPHFSAVGAVVTFVATGTNIVLLKYVHTPLILTWVCVYAVAINLSYFLNSIFTFQSALSFKRMVLYYGVYLSSMSIGVVLLKFFRSVLTWENWILPLLVLPVTAAWNFCLSSVFLKRRES